MGTGLGQVTELIEGIKLPEVIKNITQDNINLYAEASQDFNPIHIDEEFAAKTPLGGTVAHGMLVLSYVSQMMTAAFGKRWLTGGKLDIRFKAPARPGDILTISGEISRLERNAVRVIINCNVFCRNQNGEKVITGETTVGVKSNENSH